MKAKTINKILTSKHKQFVDSIKDEKVRKLVDKNSIITGGAIVSMLLDEPVNDFDYYFTDLETTTAVAEYFVKEFTKKNEGGHIYVEEADNRVKIIVSSEGVAGTPEEHELDVEQIPDELKFGEGEVVGDNQKTEGDDLYAPTFLTTNAISLRGRIQLVTRFFGDPEEIHDNYDFVHATCYWRSKDRHLELPQEALEAIITKELKYRGSKYPLASIFRTRKFIQRGWTINAGQYLKMALQLNELNLLDPVVLEEQLTGVDFAYFSMIIEAIKKAQAEDKSFTIDQNYLMAVIERVFD